MATAAWIRKLLVLFVSSYQTVTVLKIGELWAIPIMLRLALIENIRRIAVRIANDRTNRNVADYWAKRMTTTAHKDPKSLFLEIADMARSRPADGRCVCCRNSTSIAGTGSRSGLAAYLDRTASCPNTVRRSRDLCIWRASNRPPIRFP